MSGEGHCELADASGWKLGTHYSHDRERKDEGDTTQRSQGPAAAEPGGPGWAAEKPAVGSKGSRGAQRLQSRRTR